MHVSYIKLHGIYNIKYYKFGFNWGDDGGCIHLLVLMKANLETNF